MTDPLQGVPPPARGADRPRLRITATGPDDGGVVEIPVRVDAEESFSWSFTKRIPVPVDELTDLLIRPDGRISDFLVDYRDHIDPYLDHTPEHSWGVVVTGQLADPGTRTVDDEPDNAPSQVALFFVGPDQATALEGRAYRTWRRAAQAALPDDTVFRTFVDLHPDDLTPMP
ncbi:hypothetical protein [Actinokineospora iranica]|uniref:Uncharacterized protein n=1 Tax=Actinokineospora iranica TaxID=1271860 RepID=A0A1G6VQI9_9PSEU|nr:hypothetical protein [Actinokineospora iranica]SDD55848.1 hypothetical protein SAMN05216174_11342 [Actinokineospora iranica]